jgi:alpha-pyrone synthase
VDPVGLELEVSLLLRRATTWRLAARQVGSVVVTRAYINRVAMAVPDHEIHSTFVNFAERLLQDRRSRLLFERMAARSQIQHRWSCLAPARLGCNESLDADGFYTLGQFPSTARRMSRYEIEAPSLGVKAVKRLGLGEAVREITHVIVTSCTGFSAPGVDLELVRRCGLDSSVERTMIGFMGCNAAINALKLARHIVRSEPAAKVLVVSLELCTLHLQESDDIDRLLMFLLFGDGCSAALVSAEPAGLAIDGFHAIVVQKAAKQITWNIRDSGFDMVLSGQVPTTIAEALRSGVDLLLSGLSADAIDLWAVHPGGRSVLDAVEGALDLDPSALAASRAVLQNYGNMSSSTLLFVLEVLMREKVPAGARGCAMAFGPGVTAETMLFSAAA